MAFITRAQIKLYERGSSHSAENVASAQAVAFNSASAQATVFLSHSSKDRELIMPAIAFLRSHGVSVYVDWMDGGMPDVVSSVTANRIKEKIREQRKFLIILTENSKGSRWVPWELGIADIVKGMNHIAILPVSENGSFDQNEYMRIYPKIEIINNIWWVWTDDPLSITPLPEWLKK